METDSSCNGGERVRLLKKGQGVFEFSLATQADKPLDIIPGLAIRGTGRDLCPGEGSGGIGPYGDDGANVCAGVAAYTLAPIKLSLNSHPLHDLTPLG
jgi:hypothetical protein